MTDESKLSTEKLFWMEVALEEEREIKRGEKRNRKLFHLVDSMYYDNDSVEIREN